MDKNAIKTFAIESRRKMIESVKFQASLIGITADGIAEPISKAEGMETYDYGAGQHTIYDEDIKKRQSLVMEINYKGFENVVEEVAYTWFNRIIAIRYMEVNDYLPVRTRVLSSEIEGKIEPDIIAEALNLDLGLSDDDKSKIFKFKENNDNDKLFQFIFVKQCNKLNEILPGLFEKTNDYMELLFDINFTDENSVVRQLVDNIPKEDFGNQVEIIGWLYQFYNTELKDETFANLKKRIKISKERIPAATQLFTPDWIVKYMVENSVGRLWLEGHPNDDLKSKWEYYIEDAEQEYEIELKLVKIRNESKRLRLEDIKIIDPCMGSGHILVYVFDLLMQIYISEGYTQKDATESILKNNIHGLDIDDRAYQLTYFAVLMKARKYNKNILEKNIQPLIHSIKESNNISNEFKEYLGSINPSLNEELSSLLNTFKDAKEYGSTLKIKECDFKNIKLVLKDLMNDKSNLIRVKFKEELILLRDIIETAELLYLKYDIVITNPPYLRSRGMSKKLFDFLKNNFPISKVDLYSVFIEKCKNMLKPCGILSMITQHNFMFLKNFEKLRLELLNTMMFINTIHLGSKAFEEIGGEVVQTASFNFRNIPINENNIIFIKLTDYNAVDKEKEFFNIDNKFIRRQDNFFKIPGCSMAYWANDNIISTFNKGKKLMDMGDIKQGLATGANDLFLRFWFEINFSDMGLSFETREDAQKTSFKWFPYNKGGLFRKWYGNQYHVVNWKDDGFDIKELKLNQLNQGIIAKKNSKCWNQQFYFKPSISWSKMSSGGISFRYYPKGFLFDVSGTSIFINETLRSYILGFLNSSISKEILWIISPTLNHETGHISQLPIIFLKEYYKTIDDLVKNNIQICKSDWDDYEISWNFQKHFFLKEGKFLRNIFIEWENYKKNQFNLLKQNEINLNKIFSKIYLMNFDEFSDDYNISVTLADYENDIKSFISYSIGCMFGRYSLDEEGLQFAGGEFNINNYSKFIPDDDNIIPVLDTEYFNDDIVGRFVEFVKVCFGEETLEENLDFIAGALKKKGKTSREIIRNYFLTDFFKDHAQTYKKCPIYWQFDSGKQNAFKCLIYMHRYEPGLVARIRTDYLHKTQKAIEQNLAQCESIIANSSNKSEISKAKKDKTKYIKQLDEIKVYDEALAHIANQRIEIDLDDGVKVNHAKFQNVEISKEGQKVKKINLLKKI